MGDAAPTAGEPTDAGRDAARTPPTACLLGATGSGKSSTGNSFFKLRGDSEVFPVSGSTASATTKPSIETLPWRGDPRAYVRCVDIPGFGDSRGISDAEHIQNMSEILKSEVGQVNAFLIVINAMEPRFGSHLRAMLLKFKDVFGTEFLQNAFIVFTRWPFDKRSRKQLERKNETMKSKKDMINKDLRELLGHDFDISCAFLDNQLNSSAWEELQEDYDEELDRMMQEFEMELEKVYYFMRTRLAFRCCSIEAALAEKRDMMKQFTSVTRIIDMEQERQILGRRLIEEKSIFKEGELRFKPSQTVPSRRVWGVLRRQQLQLFNDQSEVESSNVSPDSVELLGCFCGAAQRGLFSGPHFTIYRPAGQLGQESRRWTLRVADERECRKWVLLVQEATQISESWSKIRQFHENLRAATSIQEYGQAMDSVSNEVMVIPVEWVLHQLRDGTQSATDALAARMPTLEQVNKDLKRDRFTIDGRLVKGPTVEELAADLALRVKAIVGDREVEKVEEKAIILARDVVLSCSRSLGDGDSLDAVRMLFQNERLVECIVVPKDVEPVSIHVLRAEGAEQILCENFKAAKADTGLPQFQGDASGDSLRHELVVGMDMEKEQRLSVHAIGHYSWIPDWGSLHCMRCGVQFRPWLRRHHCRKCGSLVCRHCSRHSVGLKETVSPLGVDGSFVVVESEQRGRVCFLCYQKAVIEDLEQRKRRSVASLESAHGSFCTDVTAASEDAEQDDSGKDTVGVESRSPESFSSTEVAAPTIKDEDEEDNLWPVVSVEMGSRYKVCDAETLDAIFFLDCRFVRQVRWNGVNDTGRVVISVSRA